MAEKYDGPGEYVGFYALWVKTGDPRWVWRAIRSAVHCGDLPDWTLNYLFDVAAGIEKAGGEAGRELHSILKFPSKPGPLRSVKQELQIERFAVGFMRRVLKGETPGKARAEAARLEGMTGDQEQLAMRLRDFFDLESLPQSSLDQSWRMIIATWLMNHYPAYVERFPDLPRPPFDFSGPPPTWFA
jgi:hypothetical protein